MTKNIVFVHGAWVTGLCWEKFVGYFESKGYTCSAPNWPCKDKPVEAQKKNPAPALGKLGIAEIVDHYDKIIRGMSEPPILIGHSFGGLFVQMLLDRGLGSAGVAIDSAPPKGVLPFYPSVVRANFRILATIGGWRKIIPPSFKDFQYAFVNTIRLEEQQAAYDRYVVPESGRIFFQAATALMNNLTTVNFKNVSRAPLLLIAGNSDHICPPQQIKSNFGKYKGSPAKTDFKAFDGRAHWIIAQPGWEEVASYINDWLA